MSDNKLQLFFHHGSPGVPEDFSVLEPHLQKFILHFVNRNIKPANPNNQNIQIGYSFGSVEAIKQAAQNPSQVKAVVLISPYIFIEDSVSLLKKVILNVPFVGSSILKKAASGAINEMVKKSSLPLSPPANYLQASQAYLDPTKLKQSIFEKDYDNNELRNAISKLKSENIPVYVIAGDKDESSKDQEQLKKLNILIKSQNKIINNAGHALLWTHTQEVVEFIKEVSMGDKSKSKLGYYDGENEKNNVYSFLDNHKANNPQKTILSWVSPEKLKSWSFDYNDPLPHEEISIAELDHIATTVAGGLTDLGIEKGDRVIVFVPMSLFMYTSMFALQKIGAIPVFLDSWARRDQLGVSAKVADPKAIISIDQAYQYLKGIDEIDKISKKVIVGPSENADSYDAQLEVLMKSESKGKVSKVAKEHTALITFTTGSSGTPKGADRSHRFLAAQHYALNRHLPYKDNDKDLPVFPIFSLNNLAAGVETVLPAIDVGVPSDKDALILISQLKSRNISCTTLSPSLLNAVSAYCLEKNIKLDFIKRVVTGGAPVSRDDLIKMREVAPNAEILVLYGSTEVEPMAHIEAKDMIASFNNDDPEWVEEGVNVGKMDEGLQYKFVKINKGPITLDDNTDWSDIELPLGSVGELIVAGEHVCEGYFNNKEAFFKAKIRDKEGVVWHRTGDLGKIDKNGDLWLVGRIHNVIIRNKEYLFPVRPEIILKKMPFVKRAAYLGMPDESKGEKTYCVFTLNEENSSASESDLEKFTHEIKRLMDKNNVPVDKIILRDEIPMDPRHHSKVEYAVLRKSLLEDKV